MRCREIRALTVRAITAVRAKRVNSLAAAAWLALWAQPADSQLRAGQTVASFELNLSNPGARSLGIAGAFAGVADDATAAYANPAALTVLARPEVSLELRRAASSLEFLSWGLFKTGGEGRVPEGVRFEAGTFDASSAADNVSFASFSYPGERWALSVYRHQLADVQAASFFERGEAFDESQETRSSVNVGIVGLGLSGAYRFADWLSLGVSLVAYEGAIDVTEQLLRSSRLPRQRSEQVNDSDLAFNLGVLARPTERWSIGAFYRKGPSFDVIQEDVSPGRDTVRTPAAPLELPDSLGLGAGFRATVNLLLSFEWARLTYSDLVRAENFPADFPEGQLEADDIDQIRIGAEYSFWESPGSLAIRFGVFYDPDHQIRAFGPEPQCPGQVLSSDLVFECRSPPGEFSLEAEELEAAVTARALKLLFPPGEDRVHLSLGVGFVVISRLQFDAAADYVSSEEYSLSFSAVVRF